MISEDVTNALLETVIMLGLVQREGDGVNGYKYT